MDKSYVEFILNQILSVEGNDVVVRHPHYQLTSKDVVGLLTGQASVAVVNAYVSLLATTRCFIEQES